MRLRNSYSSSISSSGISTGVTIGYGDGTQTSVDAVQFSFSIKWITMELLTKMEDL